MAYRQETKGSGGWIGFKWETSLLLIYINDLEEGVTSKIL